MKAIQTVFLIGSLFLVPKNSFAACIETAEESFSATFVISAIDPQVSTNCFFDPQGKVHSDQPIAILQKGCTVELTIKKLTKNSKQPAENKILENKITVYSEKDLCKKKIGAHFSGTAISTGKECCIEHEQQRMSKVQFCSKNPSKLVEQPTLQNIRCNSKGNSWKLVEKR